MAGKATSLSGMKGQSEVKNRERYRYRYAYGEPIEHSLSFITSLGSPPRLLLAHFEEEVRTETKDETRAASRF